MSSIKNYYHREFVGDTNPSGLSDVEEYELYCLYSKLKENLKTEEEVMEFFAPLWKEEE